MLEDHKYNSLLLRQRIAKIVIHYNLTSQIRANFSRTYSAAQRAAPARYAQ